RGRALRRIGLGGICAASIVAAAVRADGASGFDFRSLCGSSGELWACFVGPDDPLAQSVAQPDGPAAPGVYRLAERPRRTPFSILVLTPFSAKVHGCLGTYRMGYWPGEEGRVRGAAY